MLKGAGREDCLVRAMQAGDEDALHTIIDRYTPYVGAIVLNICCGRLDQADAAALVSDIFYTLWLNAEKICPGRLKGYLSAIARSRTLNALRKQGRELSLEDDCISIFSPAPDEELERREEYAALRRALDTMPEPDRSIFIRHYYLCQPAPDIAAIMNVNVNTVYTKLRRGREKLREELMKGGYFVE